VVSKIGIGWVSVKYAAKKRKKRQRYLKRMHSPHKKKRHARTTSSSFARAKVLDGKLYSVCCCLLVASGAERPEQRFE